MHHRVAGTFKFGIGKTGQTIIQSYGLTRFPGVVEWDKRVGGVIGRKHTLAAVIMGLHANRVQ